MIHYSNVVVVEIRELEFLSDILHTSCICVRAGKVVVMLLKKMEHGLGCEMLIDSAGQGDI